MTRYLQRPRRTTASVHVHVCINFSQSMITYVPTDVFIFAEMRSTGAHHRGYAQMVITINNKFVILLISINKTDDII